MTPQTSIVIVTRNRCDELQRALRSCLIQEGSPEIIVIDDASDDSTAAMVRENFPSVRLTSDPIRRGYIVQRNRGAAIATGEFIISIDDDAEFSSPTIVQDTVADFSGHASIAAIAIPYTEPPDETFQFQRAPDPSQCWICSQFIGTAYAVRRQIFLDLGGFDETLVHQGEERNFCIRLLQAGHHVRLGNSAPVRHHQSPQRDHARMAYHGRRNDILFSWKYVPFPQVIVRLAGTSFLGFCHGLIHGNLRAHIRGILAGVQEILQKSHRHPVDCKTYAAYRNLRKRSAPLKSRSSDV